MSELLVRTEDNTIPEDAVMDLKSWKRGMVITVQEDGWAWGTEELSNPLFVIIKVPDLTVAQAGQYLGFTDTSTPGSPDKTNPLRAFKINLDHAVFAVSKLKPGVRVPSITLPKATLSLAKIAVTLTNPLIIS